VKRQSEHKDEVALFDEKIKRDWQWESKIHLKKLTLY